MAANLWRDEWDGKRNHVHHLYILNSLGVFEEVKMLLGFDIQTCHLHTQKLYRTPKKIRISCQNDFNFCFAFNLDRLLKFPGDKQKSEKEQVILTCF